MKSKHKLVFDQMEWTSIGDEIRYKCYREGNYQVRLIEFGKDMKHVDWCIKGHYGYVLHGSAEIVFSDHSEIFEPGDVLFIPEGPEYKHRPKVLTDTFSFFSVEMNDELRT